MSRWRELWFYFWRDLLIARTYRSPFIFDVIRALIGATMFFYAARFVDSPQLRGSLPQAGGYFAFALVDLFSSTTSASPWTLSIKD